MDRSDYPSNLTDDQWKIVKGLLPAASPVGRPRVVCRRILLDAILYVNRTGGQWRQLPKEFGSWMTAYRLFWDWRVTGVWQDIHDALCGMVRRRVGKKTSPSAAIIDSQTVKTTEVGGERGYDGGKKINGRKRHLVVDTLGLLLAVVVHSAAIPDQDGARTVLAKLRGRFPRLKLVWGDSAYGRSGLPAWVKLTFGWLLQTILRPVDAIGWVLLPRRWVVERTHAWIGRCRRNSKDYERNTDSSEAMIRIAMIQLMLKRLAKNSMKPN